MLRRWPSLDPRNFSELKPNDPSSPSVCTLFSSSKSQLLQFLMFPFGLFRVILSRYAAFR